mmetsp:Transcript_41725/g.100109  ORF Transcript_41725/g.100109 Transcript_41725/m.100109 type:complete len:302 (+) Transcript_41725:654-1559(+)
MSVSVGSASTGSVSVSDSVSVSVSVGACNNVASSDVIVVGVGPNNPGNEEEMSPSISASASSSHAQNVPLILYPTSMIRHSCCPSCCSPLESRFNEITDGSTSVIERQDESHMVVAEVAVDGSSTSSVRSDWYVLAKILAAYDCSEIVMVERTGNFKTIGASTISNSYRTTRGHDAVGDMVGANVPSTIITGISTRSGGVVVVEESSVSVSIVPGVLSSSSSISTLLLLLLPPLPAAAAAKPSESMVPLSRWMTMIAVAIPAMTPHPTIRAATTTQSLRRGQSHWTSCFKSCQNSKSSSSS